MSSSYRFFRGAGERRFCFAVHPTFVCPLADPNPERPAGDVGSPWGLGIDEAAQAMGCAPGHLAEILRLAHRRRRAERERGPDGRLTDNCTVCLSKMRRLGFRAWVTDPIAQEDLRAEQRSSLAISQRLGGHYDPRVTVGEVRWFDTKKEAREWAREESRIHNAQAAEVNG